MPYKTIADLAFELALPVSDVIAQARRMGVKRAVSSTILSGPQAEQVLRFVRRMRPTSSSLESPRSRERPSINAIVERYRPVLLAMPFVIGVTVSEDPQGQPLVRVFAQRNGTALPELPDKLDGYPVLIEDVGEALAV